MNQHFSPITSEISVTSNAEKMTSVLVSLNQLGRVKDLRNRLQRLNPTTNKHECVYDVWTQKVNGQNVTFGFCAYTYDAPNNVPGAGMELLFSTNKRKVEKACQKIKETIWIPTDLLISREEFANCDRKDGINRKKF
jgi:hypothetical protein